MPVYEDCLKYESSSKAIFNSLNTEEGSHEFPLYPEGISIAFNDIRDAF